MGWQYLSISFYISIVFDAGARSKRFISGMIRDFNSFRYQNFQHFSSLKNLAHKTSRLFLSDCIHGHRLVRGVDRHPLQGPKSRHPPAGGWVVRDKRIIGKIPQIYTSTFGVDPPGHPIHPHPLRGPTMPVF